MPDTTNSTEDAYHWANLEYNRNHTTIFGCGGVPDIDKETIKEEVIAQLIPFSVNNVGICAKHPT